MFATILGVMFATYPGPLPWPLAPGPLPWPFALHSMRYTPRATLHAIATPPLEEHQATSTAVRGPRYEYHGAVDSTRFRRVRCVCVGGGGSSGGWCCCGRRLAMEVEGEACRQFITRKIGKITPSFFHNLSLTVSLLKTPHALHSTGYTPRYRDAPA